VSDGKKKRNETKRQKTQIERAQLALNQMAAALNAKLQGAASQCASLLKFGSAVYIFRDTLCEPTVVS